MYIVFVIITAELKNKLNRRKSHNYEGITTGYMYRTTTRNKTGHVV